MKKPSATAAIETRGLSYLRGGKALIDDMTVGVNQGSMMAVIGPNGAGKTTLLRLLAGVNAPSGGTVNLFGLPLAGLRRRQVARQLAHVSQDTSAHFEITVRDAVALGRFAHVGVWRPMRSVDWDVVDASITSMELVHLADRRLPTLSGGERQRVFLARALAQESPLLLLDEPTSALDIGHQLDLISKLRELNENGRTIIAAMHDLPLCWQHFDRVLLLGGGKLLCDGPAHDVLSQSITALTFGVRFSEANGNLVIDRL